MSEEARLVPEAKCLECGRPLNAVGGDEVPEPGSLLQCGYCAAVMMFDDELKPRGMTEAEMDEVLADPETLATFAQNAFRVQAAQKLVRGEGKKKAGGSYVN